MVQPASLGATRCSNAPQTDTHALPLCCTDRRRLLTAAHALHGSSNRKLLLAPSGGLSPSMPPEPVPTDFTMPLPLQLWGPAGAPGPLPFPDMAALSPEGQAVTQGEVNNDGVDVVAAARFSYVSAYPDLGGYSAVEESPAQAVPDLPCAKRQGFATDASCRATPPPLHCIRHVVRQACWLVVQGSQLGRRHALHASVALRPFPPAVGQQRARLARQLRSLTCWCLPATSSWRLPDLCCAQLKAACSAGGSEATYHQVFSAQMASFGFNVQVVTLGQVPAPESFPIASQLKHPPFQATLFSIEVGRQVEADSCSCPHCSCPGHNHQRITGLLLRGTSRLLPVDCLHALGGLLTAMLAGADEEHWPRTAAFWHWPAELLAAGAQHPHHGSRRGSLPQHHGSG